MQAYATDMNSEYISPEALDAVARKQRRDRRIALTLTVVAHAALLVLFGLVTVLPALQREPEIRATVVVQETAEAPRLSRQEVSRMHSRAVQPAADSARLAQLIQAHAPAPIAAPVVEQTFVDAPVGLGAATGLGLGRGAFGQGAGAGVGRHSFMGVQAQGRSIVLAIDISGSMANLRDRAYERVEEEAKKTLRELPQGTPFGLLLFGSEVVAFRDALAAANPALVEEAIEFLLEYSPLRNREEARERGESTNWRRLKGGVHGGTRTDLVMEQAFKLNPETIIMLSDGKPHIPGVRNEEEHVLELVRDLQRRRSRPIPVSVISYVLKSGREFMRDLAEQNDGQFVAVD